MNSIALSLLLLFTCTQLISCKKQQTPPETKIFSPAPPQDQLLNKAPEGASLSSVSLASSGTHPSQSDKKKPEVSPLVQEIKAPTPPPIIMATPEKSKVLISHINTSGVSKHSYQANLLNCSPFIKDDNVLIAGYNCLARYEFPMERYEYTAKYFNQDKSFSQLESILYLKSFSTHFRVYLISDEEGELVEGKQILEKVNIDGLEAMKVSSSFSLPARLAHRLQRGSEVRFFIGLDSPSKEAFMTVKDNAIHYNEAKPANCANVTLADNGINICENDLKQSASFFVPKEILTEMNQLRENDIHGDFYVKLSLQQQGSVIGTESRTFGVGSKFGDCTSYHCSFAKSAVEEWYEVIQSNNTWALISVSQYQNEIYRNINVTCNREKVSLGVFLAKTGSIGFLDAQEQEIHFFLNNIQCQNFEISNQLTIERPAIVLQFLKGVIGPANGAPEIEYSDHHSMFPPSLNLFSRPLREELALPRSVEQNTETKMILEFTKLN